MGNFSPIPDTRIYTRNGMDAPGFASGGSFDEICLASAGVRSATSRVGFRVHAIR